MCTRSARLVDHLTTASISPRSGLKYLETCGVKNGPNEHMYTEAKLALVKREMTVAKSLFNQCGNRYKHTARYLMQLTAYEKLCTEGVVRRVGCSDLHDRLQTILNDTSVQVGIYSDSLQRQGYTAGPRRPQPHRRVARPQDVSDDGVPPGRVVRDARAVHPVRSSARHGSARVEVVFRGCRYRRRAQSAGGAARSEAPLAAFVSDGRCVCVCARRGVGGESRAPRGPVRVVRQSY